MLLMACMPASFAAENFGGAYGCAAILDSPHPSGGFIKGHMTIKCSRPVALGHVENQLWRLRAWGWEAVGEPSQFTNKKGGKYFDTAVSIRPGSDCYYYRNTGSGFVLGFDRVRYAPPGVGLNYDIRFKRKLPPGCGARW